MSKKWYVVWVDTEPGVYSTWAACKPHIHGIAGAKYKSYDSLAEAEAAYVAGYQAPDRKTGGEVRVSNQRLTPEQLSEFLEIDPQSIAVGAACSGNPGKMEYRCVHVFGDHSMPDIFHFGPIMGTNNVAEFLAIVHALAMLKQRGDSQTVVYSDSRNAKGTVLLVCVRA